MTARQHKLLTAAVLVATTLTPGIVNAMVRARHGRGDPRAQLRIARAKAAELTRAILLAELALKGARDEDDAQDAPEAAPGKV